jgi:hypothetical protein
MIHGKIPGQNPDLLAEPACARGVVATKRNQPRVERRAAATAVIKNAAFAVMKCAAFAVK